MRTVLCLVLVALASCGGKKTGEPDGGSGGDLGGSGGAPGGSGGVMGGSGGDGGGGGVGGSGGDTGGSGGDAPIACDAPEVTDPRLTAFSTWLTGYMTTRGIDGVAVGVIDGADTYTAAYGKRGAVKCGPMRADLAVQLGSHLFVSLAAMSAAKDGLVDLDAPVSIPGTEFGGDVAWQAPSIRQLLSVCGGIPQIKLDCIESVPIADQFDGRKVPVWFEPGTMSGDESLLASMVVARALELAEGRSFEEIMRRRVFEPLQTAATFDASAAALLRPIEATTLGDVCPALQAFRTFASVQDVLAALRAVLGDRPDVVGNEAAELTADVCPYLSPIPRYGIGILGFPVFHDKDGDVFFFIRGAGASTFAALVAPANHLAVVVLVSPSADALPIAQQLLEGLPAFGRKLKPVFDYDIKKNGELVGKYTDPVGVGFGPETVDISIDATGSLFSTTGNDRQRLDVPELVFPVGSKIGDFFRLQFSVDQVGFWRDADGKVYALRFPGFPPTYREP